MQEHQPQGCPQQHPHLPFWAFLYSFEAQGCCCVCCPANPAQKMNYWALHSVDAAADAAACPAAVLAVGADAAAFAAIVDAAAVAAVGAGFCVQPSRLVLSSGAARRLELLLLPCRKASQI